MKTQRVMMFACLAGMALVMVQPAKAIFGAGDTVFIVGDAMDGMKWARESAEWAKSLAKANEQISQLRKQVEQADQMINIVGDPKRLAGELTGVFGDRTGLDLSGKVASFSTARSVMNLGDSVYGLARAGEKTLRSADRVGDRFSSFGEEIKRDASRYTAFNQQKAMIGRFEEAVQNLEGVQKHEVELQRRLDEQMRDSKMTEQARLAAQAQLTASTARLELAKAKVDQAKQEADMLAERRRLEAELRAEATTEEQQVLVQQLRERAKTSMEAQLKGRGGQL